MGDPESCWAYPKGLQEGQVPLAAGARNAPGRSDVVPVPLTSTSARLKQSGQLQRRPGVPSRVRRAGLEGEGPGNIPPSPRRMDQDLEEAGAARAERLDRLRSLAGASGGAADGRRADGDRSAAPAASTSGAPMIQFRNYKPRDTGLDAGMVRRRALGPTMLLAAAAAAPRARCGHPAWQRAAGLGSHGTHARA